MSKVDSERIDSESLTPADLPSLLHGATLFSEKRLIVINRLSENKPVCVALESYLDGLSANTDTHVVLIEPKFDKRSSIYRKLKSTAEVLEFDDTDFSKPFNRREQLKWLSAETDRVGLKLDPKAQNFLLDHVGPDKFALISALDKLSLINVPVSQTTIIDLIEPSYEQNVFTVFELALNGNKKALLEAVSRLELSGKAPREFFGLICNQAFLLLALKTAPAGVDVSGDLSVSPYSLKNLAPFAAKLSRPTVKAIIHRFAITDSLIKSSGTIDRWLIIRGLLLNVSTLAYNCDNN